MTQSAELQDEDHGAYRALLSVQDQPGWIDTAVDQVGAWLREKDLDIDLSGACQHLAGETRVQVVRHAAGGEHAFRLQLRERNEAGVWKSTVLIIDGPDPWVSIDVVNDDRQIVAPPRLVARLLDTLELTDAGQPVRAVPRHVASEAQREDLLELILSDRRGLTLVAASPSDLDTPAGGRFAQDVRRWTGWTVGLSHVAIVDPGSTQWLIDESHGALRVPVGTIRSFRPGLDLAVDATLRGHRVMGQEQLSANGVSRTRRLFGLFSHIALAGRPEPTRVAAWRRTLDRIEAQAAADALRSRGTASRPAADSVRRSAELKRALEVERQRATEAVAELERVRRVLGLHDLATATLARLLDVASPPALVGAESLDRLRQQAAAAQKQAHEVRTESDAVQRAVREALGVADLSAQTLQEVAELAEQGALVQEMLDDAASDLEAQAAKVEDASLSAQVSREAEWAARQDATDLLDQFDQLETRNRFLATRLRQAGDYDQHDPAAPVEDPDSPCERPGSWQDLVDSVLQWDRLGVIITADVPKIMELDPLDIEGRALHAAWSGLRAFAGYRRAKADGVFAGGLGQYLSAAPDGYARYNAGKFVPNETKYTKSHFGDERVFPCPVDVHPDGEAVMSAHLRLSRIPNKDPRMHLLDVTGSPQDGQVGVVVVGYIGVHLTNRRTASHN